jgi:hypothetical protein
MSGIQFNIDYGSALSLFTYMALAEALSCSRQLDFLFFQKQMFYLAVTFAITIYLPLPKHVMRDPP